MAKVAECQPHDLLGLRLPSEDVGTFTTFGDLCPANGDAEVRAVGLLQASLVRALPRSARALRALRPGAAVLPSMPGTAAAGVAAPRR